MNVTLTTNGAARFALIETDHIDMSVLLAPGMPPAEALRQYADELQAKADRRLLLQIATLREAATLV